MVVTKYSEKFKVYNVSGKDKPWEYTVTLVHLFFSDSSELTCQSKLSQECRSLCYLKREHFSSNSELRTPGNTIMAAQNNYISHKEHWRIL